MKQDIAEQIVAELKLDDAEVARRLALLHISHRDKECLSTLQPILDTKLEELVDKTIERMALDPDVGTNFHDGAVLFRFRDTFITSLRELLAGELNVEHAYRCLTLGVSIHRMGMSPGLYVGFFASMLTQLLEQAVQLANTEEGCSVDAISSIAKLALFDLALFEEAYFHTEHLEIEKIAKHDVLTGLANYNFLRDLFSQRTSLFGSGEGLSLLYVGLDRFKQINETLGHAVGDIILKEVARRLQEIFDDNTVIARMGGDVFVVIRRGAAAEEEALGSVLLVMTAMMPPFAIDTVNVDVTATIGIDVRQGEVIDPESMLKCAEVAYYTAKDRQITHLLYSSDMQRYSTDQVHLLGELRRAIDKRELFLCYQPKVSMKTGIVVGAEALIRWNHPERGLISPAMFIPAAEQTSLIHPLTSWVLRNAANRAHYWQRLGRDISVSVNLSAPNLQNADLVSEIKALLNVYMLEPSRLVLEVTETGMMADKSQATEVLAKLRELGVKTSIDDFGTGYSSLAYLKGLPVDELKIDRHFVSNMVDGSVDAAIVRATIELARGMGLMVVAEGIEHIEAWNKLVDLGCDFAQGTFICGPLSADEFEKWIDTHTKFVAPSVSDLQDD